MPRYHFHLRVEDDVPDSEGQELPDKRTAIAQAAFYAREMAAESVRAGSLDLSHSISVSDEAGLTIHRVTFGEAVEIIPANPKNNHDWQT